LITALALAAITTAARAQPPSLPNPTAPLDFSLGGRPGTFAQPSGAVASDRAGEGCEPTPPRVELGVFDTITQSVFGKPDPDTWRPLLLSTLFSEGWNEAWVPSPNGSGGAPRQGWINAIDGNLYRLGFVTFAEGVQPGPDEQRL
jgi:hypothetical protein